MHANPRYPWPYQPLKPVGMQFQDPEVAHFGACVSLPCTRATEIADSNPGISPSISIDMHSYALHTRPQSLTPNPCCVSWPCDRTKKKETRPTKKRGSIWGPTRVGNEDLRKPGASSISSLNYSFYKFIPLNQGGGHPPPALTLLTIPASCTSTRSLPLLVFGPEKRFLKYLDKADSPIWCARDSFQAGVRYHGITSPPYFPEAWDSATTRNPRGNGHPSRIDTMLHRGHASLPAWMIMSNLPGLIRAFGRSDFPLVRSPVTIPSRLRE